MRYRFLFRGSPRMDLFRQDWSSAFKADLTLTASQIANLEPDALNTAKLDALYLWKNSGAFARLGGAVANMMPAPFALLGKELFDFSAGVDWRYRLRGKLIRHMIHRAHPKLAAFPTWYGGSAAPMSLTRPLDVGNFYLEGFKKLVRKIGTVTIKRPIFRDPCARHPTPSHDQDFVNLLASEGFLDVNNLQTTGLYDENGLGELLNSAREHGFKNHGELYAIVSIEHLSRCLENAVGDPF